MTDLPVYFDTITGTASQVIETLVRRLSAYARRDRVRWFKIGITNDPERRFLSGYAGSYDEMIVLYETSSIDFVSQLEAALVDYNWKVTDNLIGGGGGGIGHPPYFLYIVLRL